MKSLLKITDSLYVNPDKVLAIRSSVDPLRASIKIKTEIVLGDTDDAVYFSRDDVETVRAAWEDALGLSTETKGSKFNILKGYQGRLDELDLTKGSYFVITHVERPPGIDRDREYTSNRRYCIDTTGCCFESNYGRRTPVSDLDDNFFEYTFDVYILE